MSTKAFRGKCYNAGLFTVSDGPQEDKLEERGQCGVLWGVVGTFCPLSNFL
jgi:hypothetical protein